MVQQQQPAPPMETTAAPQLMSPMVFAGQGQDHQPSPGPAAVPVRAPPMGLPVITPVSIPVSMPLIAPPVMPFNGVPAFHMPVQVPQVTPLTEAQLTQVNIYYSHIFFRLKYVMKFIKYYSPTVTHGKTLVYDFWAL